MTERPIEERLRDLVPESVADDPKSETIREAADTIERLRRGSRFMGKMWFEQRDRADVAEQRVRDTEAERDALREALRDVLAYFAGPYDLSEADLRNPDFWEDSTKEHPSEDYLTYWRIIDRARALLSSPRTGAAPAQSEARIEELEAKLERAERERTDIQADANEIEADYDDAEARLLAFRSAVRQHYLAGVECDHDGKRDRSQCGFGDWQSEWQPNVGAAVDCWMEHVDAVTGSAAPPSAEPPAELTR